MNRHCLWLVPLLLLSAGDAQAHRFAPSLLKFFEIGEGRYQVIWKTPAQRTSRVPLLPVFPDHCRVTDGDPSTLEGTGVVIALELECAGGLVGSDITVNGLPENQSSVLFSLETLDGLYYQSLLNPEQPVFEIPAEPTVVEVVLEYLWLGAEHIWGGLDHLLFVFGLLLLVGWGRRLVWTVTAFTLGHSVTLSLVTLGFLEYPVALVEFAIALSIFVLAVELAHRDGAGVFRRHPWWLAGGFGLLHGMGFAGALAEVGLPQAEVPLALLFFNIGIEIGQLAFIFAAVALWWILRQVLRWVLRHGLAGRGQQGPPGQEQQWLASQEQRWLVIPVYVLGSLAAMWCIERGLGMF